MVKYYKKVVVVIPIHNDSPSTFELVSFQQCFNVLGKHPIKIIAPYGLSLDKYQEIVPNLDVVFIDKIWQSSIEKYNKLKLSKFFYKLFDNYQYLLTYELDAFVFKDELIHWCNRGYDYIGAPWFVGYETAENKFLGVGNSGFSLRKIKAMQNAIKKVYLKDAAYHTFGKKTIIALKLSVWLNYIRIYFGENYTIQYADHINEDVFISEVIAIKIKKFKLAPIDEAISFAFEVKPKDLYQLNQKNLPMGCHGWWKYDFKFWQPFIENFGFKIDLPNVN
ncbi:DUF5672 family protein [Mariniflexile gromovii]|uniref:DUF5672 domain-containing protein n=1 Tax=Mariniflexile gromovii TaxID=362523 RepID=A0ABS4BVA6_9FLAO|nr:DUF5672 family protein [Mariniflexile gromovii]MBP0904517.1 hypothetical protein [Mariniflexile gromovii]